MTFKINILHTLKLAKLFYENNIDNCIKYKIDLGICRCIEEAIIAQYPINNYNKILIDIDIKTIIPFILRSFLCTKREQRVKSITFKYGNTAYRNMRYFWTNTNKKARLRAFDKLIKTYDTKDFNSDIVKIDTKLDIATTKHHCIKIHYYPGRLSIAEQINCKIRHELKN